MGRWKLSSFFVNFGKLLEKTRFEPVLLNELKAHLKVFQLIVQPSNLGTLLANRDALALAHVLCVSEGLGKSHDLVLKF